MNRQKQGFQIFPSKSTNIGDCKLFEQHIRSIWAHSSPGQAKSCPIRWENVDIFNGSNMQCTFWNILKISTYFQKYWTQGSSNKNEENSLTGGRDPSGGGYFIFSFKDSKIKIVNITPVQQKMITVIIKRHCQVSKEGWEHGRSMTYFFKITKIGNSSQTIALD